jgi:hypothetical protein
MVIRSRTSSGLTPQAFPTHCSELPDNRMFPEEFWVYETMAIVQLARDEWAFPSGAILGRRGPSGHGEELQAHEYRRNKIISEN